MRIDPEFIREHIPNFLWYYTDSWDSLADEGPIRKHTLRFKFGPYQVARIWVNEDHDYMADNIGDMLDQMRLSLPKEYLIFWKWLAGEEISSWVRFSHFPSHYKSGYSTRWPDWPSRAYYLDPSYEPSPSVATYSVTIRSTPLRMEPIQFEQRFAYIKELDRLVVLLDEENAYVTEERLANLRGSSVAGAYPR